MRNLFLFLLLSLASITNGEIIVGDVHNRNLGDYRLDLLDWDGVISNPAIQLLLWGPQGLKEDAGVYPISVRVTSSTNQIYFGEDSSTDASKSEQLLKIENDKKPAGVLVAVWSDRNTSDEDHSLIITYRDAKGNTGEQRVLVHVKDEDTGASEPKQLNISRESNYPFVGSRRASVLKPAPFAEMKPQLNTPADFNITLDTSQDETGSFEANSEALVTARRAFDDWAYFFRAMDVDPVSIGEEQTQLVKYSGKKLGWNLEVENDRIVRNQIPFKDVLVYLTGSTADSSRSACTSPGENQFQKKGHVTYPMGRSAQVLLSFAGAGFHTHYHDEDWWRPNTNRRGKQRDLYSYVLHEAGHALGMAHANPIFRAWYQRREVDDLRVEYYLGHAARINDESHFVKGKKVFVAGKDAEDDPEVDPVSRMPAFGGVRGDMHMVRWSISKLDLLIFQALGYPMRTDTSAFRALTMTPVEVPEELSQNSAVKVQFQATGGVAVYDWKIADGELPEGLELNRFTGELAGVPTKRGLYRFVLRVRDSSNVRQEEVARAYQMTVI